MKRCHFRKPIQVKSNCGMLQCAGLGCSCGPWVTISTPLLLESSEIGMVGLAGMLRIRLLRHFRWYFSAALPSDLIWLARSNCIHLFGMRSFVAISDRMQFLSALVRQPTLFHMYCCLRWGSLWSDCSISGMLHVGI